jgi:signal transduction histidine kinase
MEPTSPSPRRLRVLHLEDSELDHELAATHLRRSGLDVTMRRIESEAELRHALGEPWDAVLSDFNLPGFGGLEALAMVRAAGRAIPFILLSGEIGEDMAVQSMRHGASDYLLKQNMARLAPALENAIAAAEAARARQAADRELALSRQRLSELAQHLQTSIDGERAAIAREIHDDVGGSLVALKFDLAWIERRTVDPEVRQRVQSALETVSHALESSKRIMHNLRPAILEQGLVAALQWMASRFEKRTGIGCVFRSSDDELPELPAGVPLVAYRTAQEALTNVSKHAHATRVTIDLALSRGELLLEVADNGVGLTRDDLAKARSFGIRGLHERASTVGGTIELTSTARGTTLLLTVPLQDAAAAAASATPAAEPDAGPDSDLEHDPTSAWGDL